MITIIYESSGIPITDFNWKGWIENVVNRKNFDCSYWISTSLGITAIQLAIVSGELDPNDTQLKWKNRIYKINKYGAIVDRPSDLISVESRIYEEILRKAVEIKKSERINWPDTAACECPACRPDQYANDEEFYNDNV